jgi:deoxycytidine triphosphate deaminase
MSPDRRLFDGLRRYREVDQYFPPRRVLHQNLERSPHRDEIIAYVENRGGNVKKDLLRWPKQRGGVLTDIGILRHMLAGNILIDPFNSDQLTSNGYDVRVGHDFFRKRTLKDLVTQGSNPLRYQDENVLFYDPYSLPNVDFLWGEVETPMLAAELLEQRFRALKGGVISVEQCHEMGTLAFVDKADRLIILGPGEMILARTIEKIGGAKIVTAMIAGKSTSGRHGFEVCSDAFLGDVGFQANWVLEIVNKHQQEASFLVVGTVLATIIFQELTEPPLINYEDGTYSSQGADNVARMKPKPLRVIKDNLVL